MRFRSLHEPNSVCCKYNNFVFVFEGVERVIKLTCCAAMEFILVFFLLQIQTLFVFVLKLFNACHCPRYLINLHRQCCATLIWEESLRSASAADEVVVKLAKKGVPVLTFEIRTHLGPIMQDVPVTVLSAVRLAECCEPEVETDVGGFTLPTLTRLHSVVERMKGLGTRLELEASIGERHAVLSIHMLTDSVSVSTTYRQLPRANMMDGTGSAAAVAQPENGPHKATMDLKNFSKSLYGHLIQPKHAICFILRHCVLVHLMGNDSMDVSYYIPRLLY